MNIMYTTNGNFVGKVATSICSVFENNKNMDEITVFIVGQGLTEEDNEKFLKIGDYYKRKIVLIELGEISSYIDFDFDTNGWNSIVLARLLLDRLLPMEVDKVLYLDGDTVVINSLKDLWLTDMSNCILGACIEATVDYDRRKNLGMAHLPYINAGVLLINLKKWREEKTGQKILEYYKKHNGNLFANDQDAINGALKNQIFYLGPEYNFYNIYWHYPYKVLKKLMKDTYYYSEEIVQKAIKRPVIIHYLGEERPWRKGNTHKYRAYYYKYLEKTPWHKEEPEKGWELYFACWNVFNVIIRPFPMLRYRIINRLIPFVLSWRKRKLNKGKAGRK